LIDGPVEREEMVGQGDARPVGGWGRGCAASWVTAVSLAVIGFCMVMRLGEGEQHVLPAAFGQASRQAGARGIFAFSGQLSEHSYGLFMVDVDAGTLWCYEYIEGQKKFRLAGARSWIYDRYLENKDFLEPSPEAVEQLVDQQRIQKLKRRTGNTP